MVDFLYNGGQCDRLGDAHESCGMSERAGSDYEHGETDANLTREAEALEIRERMERYLLEYE